MQSILSLFEGPWGCGHASERRAREMHSNDAQLFRQLPRRICGVIRVRLGLMARYIVEKFVTVSTASLLRRTKHVMLCPPSCYVIDYVELRN